MSSYGGYCQRLAAECARRARVASSPEIAAYHRSLGLRWLKLAQKERAKTKLKTWFANKAPGQINEAAPSAART
jgi:hypothetical protein